MQKKITTNSAKETQELGEKLVKDILTQLLPVSPRRDGVGARKSALVLALQGDLGGGKTTFLQGFAKGLGIKEKILSPTFVLIKRFKITAIPQNRQPSILRYRYFYHIDCYRINSAKDINGLGFGDIISNSENIVAIEWSERIKKRLPKLTITIKFNFLKRNKRKIVIYPVK